MAVAEREGEEAMARKRHRLGGPALAVAALALVACSHQRMIWTKEGLTQDELRRDQKACLAEADSYGFLQGGGSDSMGGMAGSSTAATRQQGDIYRSCMNQRGYSQAPAGATTPKPPLPAE
jgi:hypothetical protein